MEINDAVKSKIENYSNAVICKHHYSTVYRFMNQEVKCCVCDNGATHFKNKKFSKFDLQSEKSDCSFLSCYIKEIFKKDVLVTEHSKFCKSCYCSMRRRILADKEVSQLSNISDYHSYQQALQATNIVYIYN